MRICTNNRNLHVLSSYKHVRMMSLRLIMCIVTTLLITPIHSQTRRALVVGISEYKHTTEDSWSEIHGSNDADLITPVLKKQGFRVSKICNRTATAKRIRKELENIVKSSRPGDFIYIHFSGHGQPYEDMDGDEEDGWDESIIPYDALKSFRMGIYEGENHITDDEMHTYLQKIRRIIGSKGFLYLIIDACHAGESSRGDEEIEGDEDYFFVRGTKKGFSPHKKEFRPRINTRGNFVIPKETGLSDILVLEACRSYQSNYEIKQSGKYYGPMSYYIYQVLSKQEISCNIDWVNEVRRMMNSDRRVARQNMVYETSLE